MIRFRRRLRFRSPIAAHAFHVILLVVLMTSCVPASAGRPAGPSAVCDYCTFLPLVAGKPDGRCASLTFSAPSRVATRTAQPASPAPGGRPCWALIGNDGQHLSEEYEAGIRYKLVSLSWRQFSPAQGRVDSRYVDRKRAELEQLRRAGFGIILSLGYHDAPDWVHNAHPDSHYGNQYGDRYSGGMDSGDLNLVFNAGVRAETAAYIAAVFRVFGTEFAAVRLGGGSLGELTYPPAEYNGHSNAYWAFDAQALSQSPVPNWRPGDPSPNGEARRFLTWYLDRLVAFQNWQISTVRISYPGQLMMLYPSWGVRPGNIEDAVAGNLNGSTSAEKNGEVQRGFDFARQVAAISDPGVILTTTWLDADRSGDSRSDERYWSPVRYLATLAAKHPLKLLLYGENTGEGSVRDMERSAEQMRRYGLIGMAWYNERELFSGDHAGLEDYKRIIRDYSGP